MSNGDPSFPTSKDEIQGTSECPVCGKDSPHQHAVDAIRWYGDHFPRFMLAINKGEPKEKFDWGGLYPDPVERDAPPRFRNEWYQSRWESYCWCVLIGLIPARPPFEAEPNSAVETSAIPAQETRRQAFEAWWKTIWVDGNDRSSPAFDEQMKKWSHDAWRAGADYERRREAATRSSEKASAPGGKPCTCDNSLGSSCACRVDAGERLGDLWYCRKRAESVQNGSGESA